MLVHTEGVCKEISQDSFKASYTERCTFLHIFPFTIRKVTTLCLDRKRTLETRRGRSSRPASNTHPPSLSSSNEVPPIPDLASASSSSSSSTYSFARVAVGDGMLVAESFRGKGTESQSSPPFLLLLFC